MQALLVFSPSSGSTYFLCQSFTTLLVKCNLTVSVTKPWGAFAIWIAISRASWTCPQQVCVWRKAESVGNWDRGKGWPSNKTMTLKIQSRRLEIHCDNLWMCLASKWLSPSCSCPTWQSQRGSAEKKGRITKIQELFVVTGFRLLPPPRRLCDSQHLSLSRWVKQLKKLWTDFN